MSEESISKGDPSEPPGELEDDNRVRDSLVSGEEEKEIVESNTAVEEASAPEEEQSHDDWSEQGMQESEPSIGSDVESPVSGQELGIAPFIVTTELAATDQETALPLKPRTISEAEKVPSRELPAVTTMALTNGHAKSCSKQGSSDKNYPSRRFYGMKIPIPQQAEWIFHPAAGVIQDNMLDCGADGACSKELCRSGPSVHDYTGPTKSRRRKFSRLPVNVLAFLYCSCGMDRDHACRTWVVNPTASVPMRPLTWKRMTWLSPKRLPVEEWKVREDTIKDKRDHDMALKNGYETLLGNLVHIDIPGTRDLNRSWVHFLRQDVMVWGFPYTKGSTERPQLPPPSPYLVHQLKERLWKYPRVRFFKTRGGE